MIREPTGAVTHILPKLPESLGGIRMSPLAPRRNQNVSFGSPDEIERIVLLGLAAESISALFQLTHAPDPEFVFTQTGAWLSFRVLRGATWRSASAYNSVQLLN